jgi:GTP pyrophosphokinase
MVHLNDILEKVKGYHPGADIDLINRSFAFAEKNHVGQLRRSGDPYFVHPASVANIIADMRLDAASVCAAVLHDLVEDTGVTTEEIASEFGEEVAFLVDGVTKLGKINFTCREDRQAESFRKMMVAMARDIRVLLVKLADRLDNMRTLEHMKLESQERIARETLEIYAPLAGRLGIGWLKAELEDLSFRYLWPDAHRELQDNMDERARNSDEYVHTVTDQLQAMLVQRGFAVEVSGREKHLYSIYRKMRRTGCEFDQVHDVIAFRILMETIANCYAALGVVHSEWTPIPGRFKDFIALPKPNLYQSLHTTVIGPERRRIEIQIRTQGMHRTAEFGIAAHWQYKQKGSGLDKKDAERFAWLRQLMEFQQVEDPAEFYDSVRVDLFSDEIFVFTPQGDVKTFPRGSTPVDFAYCVHTEVGHRCAGARINGVMIPLRTKMRNGDVIEILTSKTQHPNKGWLEFVVTGRARSRIRNYLRSEERKQSIELGKDLLDRHLRKQQVSLSKLIKSKELGKVLEKTRTSSPEELFAQVGIGRLDCSAVSEALAPQDDTPVAKEIQQGFIERTMDRVTRKRDDTGICIQGVDNVLVRFAKCCNPVAGEPITGWITRGRGVTVHRRGCPSVMELDTQRRVDVSWGKNSHVDLPVCLRVNTADRPGILSKISAIFTENQVNIMEANCRSESGRAENTFHFEVSDLNRLNSVIRGISHVEGVFEVERI